MRELTKNEIDNAPGWATHYWIAEGELHIRWQNNKELKYMWTSDANTWSKRAAYPFTESGQPIPRKPFHISDVWHSSTYNILENGSIELVDDPTLDRNQVIDLARHFNVKEDL